MSTASTAAPHSVEAEQATLGGILLDPGACREIAAGLDATDFYRPNHRLIAAAIATVARGGSLPDAVVVAEHLNEVGKLEEAGGAAYLRALERDTPTAANVRAYLDYVRAHATRRRLLQCVADPARPAELQASLESELARLRGGATAAQEAGKPLATGDGRHVIQLEAGQLHRYADETERLIAGDVYVRGQQLARLGMAPELSRGLKDAIKRAPEQRVIIAVNAEYLRRELARRAEFQKFSRSKNEWHAVDCPRDLCSNILMAGDWQHFRPLEGIATAPFLRPDLTVCDMPGYDAASGVYYAPNTEFPPLPVRPTKDDAWSALARLREPFRQFPYAEGAEAAFLAHVLASVARHAIDTMPVFAYTAPIVASGKTLLASMASRIANGVEPGISPYTDDGEELRKVLFAALLAGDSTVMLDNVPNGAKVRAPILCGFTTAAVYSDRRLGASERMTLPNRCSVLLTGNNVTPAGDLARRCLVIRLDVDAETARGRVFSIPDLKVHVAMNRPQLLVDALTVLIAYAQAAPAGMPKPLESFETFSRIARDPLVWLDIGDAVDTQQLETEDELAPLREAFSRLASHPAFGFKTFAARDIAQECEQFMGAELRAAIEAAGCSDAASAVKVGYWLREYRDRVAAGRKLVHAGTGHGKTGQWRLREEVNQ